MESKYVGIDGKEYSKKPEHMTQLFGNILVKKTDPRIIFRGKLDSLAAQTLETQLLAKREGYTEVMDNLQEVLSFISMVMMSEVAQVPIDDISLFGLTGDELRLHSHNPKKYCGVDHMLPHYEMGSTFASLNVLRTATREVELASTLAFVDADETCSRSDILTALNRLSSAIYIIMCRVLAGDYTRSQN